MNNIINEISYKLALLDAIKRNNLINSPETWWNLEAGIEDDGSIDKIKEDLLVKIKEQTNS